MSAILDVDLATFLGRLGGLYGKYRLCPPFLLHEAAERWIARGIPLSHCVEVIERYLSRHADGCYSGSGDWNFAWLSNLVQTSWYQRQVSPLAQSKRPKMQREFDRPWVDQQPGNHEVDPRRRPITGEAPVGSRSEIPTCGRADQPVPQPGNSIGPNRKQQNRLDEATAFLRRELADGEVAATRLEEKAKARGISTRTLDRARARLKVNSRRTGFAKIGKCWLSLPTTP